MDHQLHFILFPLLAPGHIIPIIDIARSLAKRGIIVTIITTPLNGDRFAGIIARATQSGLQIRIQPLPFPCQEAGLPQGCENFDLLPSLDYSLNFFTALSMLQQPAETLFEKLKPKPSCLISDFFLPWTSVIAKKFNVPRISFNGFSCMCNLCIHTIHNSNVLDDIISHLEYFPVPDLPDHIKITKSQLPMILNPNNGAFRDQILAAEMASEGMIINTFEGLESAYIQKLRSLKPNKIWCVGPVSLYNSDDIDKIERGKKMSVDQNGCLKWLESQQPKTVVYACLGSVSNLTAMQLKELGLGLEASESPFIWVLRDGKYSWEMEKWISEDGFEERVKGRGLVLRGWVPQILILSHKAIGGFLTHCGWNSILESISMELPMVTWPLFEDQFCNEKLVAQVVQIGVSVGMEIPIQFGAEEKAGVLAYKQDFEKAIKKVMSDQGDEMRKRSKELEQMAKTSVQHGGSSHLNFSLLIQHISSSSCYNKSQSI